jgi:hypothetical protein
MPSEIYIKLSTCLIVSIHRYWKWRRDAYWRQVIKDNIAALRYIRSI